MSRVFGQLFEGLRKSLREAPSTSYDQARTRRPALRDYPTLDSALGYLAKPGASDLDACESLLRAFVGEFKLTDDPFWSSALLVSFFPMLCHLRMRLLAPATPGDELDQLVVTAFLDALMEIREREIRDRLAMRLRQRTRRRVYWALRRDLHYSRALVSIDEVPWEQERDTSTEREEKTHQELFELTQLLDRAPELGLLEQRLQVLMTTVLAHESLRDYVARLVPQGGAERRRAYQRLKRQRSRLLRRLRVLMSVGIGLWILMFSGGLQ